MNTILARTIDKHSPKFNKKIVDGAAKDMLKLAPNHLDKLFSDGIAELKRSGFNIPLEYEGYVKLTPEEEFNKKLSTDKTNNKAKYDISVSDFYTIEFRFKYNGTELIKRPLYLPFAEKGNLMNISSKVYSIIPILSDTVISPNRDNVFIRLLKDKITIESDAKNIKVNGEREHGTITHTKILKTDTMGLKNKLGGNVLIPLGLYLLAKYGFAEVCKRYCKTDRVIISDDNIDHLRDTYNVYESTRIKPHGLKTTIGYLGHKFKILVPKDIMITEFMRNFIFSTIYVLDNVTDNEVLQDLSSILKSGNVYDETYFWKIRLGILSYKGNYGIGRIAEDMKGHFDALDDYLDSTSKSKLAEAGIYMNDFYDLLAHIMENFNTLIMCSKEYNSDINNRYIDILYYMLYDITIGFNKMLLNLRKRASKKMGILSSKELTKIVSDGLKTKGIFGLVKSTNMNITIQLVDMTSDIYYPKITALIDDQSRGDGVKRSKKNRFPESTKSLHGPDLYLGSLLFLNKTAPTPRLRSNLYMDYNIYTGKLIIPEDIQKTIDKLDKLLRIKSFVENVDILEDNADIKGEL